MDSNDKGVIPYYLYHPSMIVGEWAYDTDNWTIAAGVATYLDVGTSPLNHVGAMRHNIPADSSIKISFTISNSNSTARLAVYKSDGTTPIINYEDYADGD